MKQKLETILALDDLLELAVYNVNKANPGSDLHILWSARRDMLVAQSETAWAAVADACCEKCDCEDDEGNQPDTDLEADPA